MKISRKVAVRALALTAAGGAVLGFGATAFAATPPYEQPGYAFPAANSQLGQVLFYDNAGNLVTGGNVNDAPFAKYAVATSDDPKTANTTGSLYLYTPGSPGTDPTSWSGELLSGPSAFPVAAPANVAAAGTHRPVVTVQSADNTLAVGISDFPNTNAAGSGWDNLYQLRIKTAGNDPKYWASDIQVSGTGANETWSLVYPTITSTTTALSATPASPTTVPAPAITLKATITDGAAGSVKFMDTDSNTQVGSTQTVTGSPTGNNSATVNIPAGLAQGTHHYSAVYTPAVGSPFTGSNNTLTYQVNPKPADHTNTTLSINPAPTTAGDQFTMSSKVTDTTDSTQVPSGTVAFWDNGSPIAGATGPVDSNGNVSVGPSGFGLGAGAHSITAHFTPTDSAKFEASVSGPNSFTLSPAVGDPCLNQPAPGSPQGTANPYPNDPRTNLCSDPQSFQVEVPTGSLVISTPYDGSDAAHTFDLGTMQLSGDGTFLHTKPKDFGTAGASPAWSNGVTITDTRSGDLPWHADITTTDFVKGADSINGCNLGFTSVAPHYITNNAIRASKPVTPTDQPNSGPDTIYAPNQACSSGVKGGSHTFASISHGAGSVYIGGQFDLYAPTSTKPGTYTGTVTFTLLGTLCR